MKKCILSVLVFVFILFSLLPTFYEIVRSGELPAGRSFELVHNYYTDYNFYLSRIREGREGRWTALERYTSELHEGSFIQILYVLIGRATRHIQDWFFAITAGYHVARLVFAFLFVSLIAWYAAEKFKSALGSILAFLLAVTASSWPILVAVGGSWRFGGYMPWWSVMDSLQRITFVPHILLGQSLLFFLIMAGSNPRVIARQGNTVFLGFLAFILGMVFPPGLLFVGVAYSLILIYEAIQMGILQKKANRQSFLFGHAAPRILVCLFGLPALLYFKLMLSFYPWKRLVDFDVLNPTAFYYIEYIKALGPALPMGIIGLILVIVRKETQYIGFAAWVIAWMALMWVFQYVPQQSPLRFTEMAPFIPLGFLSAYLFITLVRLPNMTLIFKSISLACAFMVIILGIGTMYSSLLWQKDFLDQKRLAGWPLISMNNYIVYPIQNFTKALSYLAYDTPAGGVVLSDLTAGNYIPAYTGKTVYVGHDNTAHKEEKLEEARRFFAGKLPGNQAREWLQKEHISYVFFGPQEQEIAGTPRLESLYPFLTAVFVNPEAAIYSFQ